MLKALFSFGGFVLALLLLAMALTLSNGQTVAMDESPTKEQVLKAFQERDAVLVQMMERIVALEAWKESKERKK